MRLFIAEKPELGRAIVDALAGDKRKDNGCIRVGSDIVTWCFGHLLQLKNPHEYDAKYEKWCLGDLPFKIKNIEFKATENKLTQINIIKNLLKEVDEVVHAGDPDEEGQLIVDSLLEYLGNTKPVLRVLINDNTKVAVQKSLKNLKDNKAYIGLRNSAFARSVADWKYGLNLTRAYTLKFNSSKQLSVGRVQTPILNLVFERELEIKSHKKECYYNLSTNNGFKFVIPKNKLEDGICKDKLYLDNIKFECQNSNDFIISNIIVKKQENQSPLPYNLLELQTDAFKKFNYKPDKVKNITQILREKHKIITYNRSDCQYLTSEHYDQREYVINVIRNNINEFSEAKIDVRLKHRAFNNANVSAHHAIIPTINLINIRDLSIEEFNIYSMIAERYLVLFMSPEVLEQTNCIAKNSSGLEFEINFSKTLSLGYKDFYSHSVKKSRGQSDENTKSNKNNTDREYNNISNFKRDDFVKFENFILTESYTKAKQLYTFATLFKDLTSVAKYIKNPDLRKIMLDKDKDKKSESGGIGTPATRDNIVKTLFDRGFLEEKNSKIITTKLGKEFLSCLPLNAKTPDMTALWSEKQNEIKNNKLSVDEFLASIDAFIMEEISRVKLSNGSIKNNLQRNESDKLHKCPNCEKGYLVRRKGMYSNFWGCNGYPNCKAVFKNYKGKPFLVKGVK